MRISRYVPLLTDLGLTENEAEVYLGALSLGPTTILAIAKQVGIRRTTVYSVVESLQSKGLMLTEMEGLKKRYCAVSPDNLESMLERKRERLQKYMPELSAAHNFNSSESTIRYYDGLPLVKQVYNELLERVKPGDDYYVFGDQQQWLSLDEEFFMKFIRRRAKLNIKTKVIMLDSSVAREHKRLEKNFNEQVRILTSPASLTTNLIVHPQMAVTHQLSPSVSAIATYNPSTIRTYQEMFLSIWNSLTD